MNNIKKYLLLNPSLKNLNLIELKKCYEKDILDENKITSIDKFFKKYPTFDTNIFKKNNPNIAHLSQIEILGYFNSNKHNEIINDENINNEYNKHEKNIKLAHIFVHFFKIGGGESYLEKFSNYNHIFEETIFINSNYNHETLFNYKSNIILYDNYHDLNNKIKNYDIIIDHQLYWFELNITKMTFLNIQYNKIIRIIHGVPIHHINIQEYNFYYSIELYNDLNSHISWNNHIKIYNNIGVTKNNKNILFDENNINVAIMGRINENKIPNMFLKMLLNFLLYCNKYKFNFYGEIDETYKKFFMNKINNNKNIIYHGIINPMNVNNIYLNNDILLHPSKMEAGATVILEAMSYGLPIICRNIYGMENAIGNKENISLSLCNNEKEMFEKLLLINNNNYNDISKNNILKILNENSEKILFKKLINEIKLIYDIEMVDEIPNIIHYIYGLKKQTEEFSFVYYLSILSNYIINKPLVIYFHYQYLPYGYWWEKVKKYIKLNYINTSNIYWNEKKIIKFAHKADKIRLELLLKYGGVYMDIDTITYRPYKDLLKYDFVIGIQEENYGKNNITLYCNAILFSKKNNIFIKKWIEEYEKYFLPNGWCEASVHLPRLIFNIINENEKKNIKILNKEYFYSPSYTNVDKIFENENEVINDNLLTLHLWNTYSEKYYKNIKNFDWCYTNKSLYSSLIKNILNNINEMSLNGLDLNEMILNPQLLNLQLLNNIYNISIITIFNSNLNYKNLLYSIANQKFFYKFNLELIIIDDTLLFNDIYNNDIELKNLFIQKNFNIKIIEIIELNIDNIYDLFNIGIINSKYDLISFFNINDIIIDNGILFQFYNYENIILLQKNKYKILCSTKHKNINILNNNFINNISNKIQFGINNLIFNKKYINYYFPNKKMKFNIENNLIFFIINTVNENYVYFDNNVITYTKENILFEYKSDEKFIDNIHNDILLYNYYDSNNNYIEFIKEIHNY
jgi:hypothetical protein